MEATLAAQGRGAQQFGQLLRNTLREFTNGPVNSIASCCSIIALLLSLLGTAGVSSPKITASSAGSVSTFDAASRFMVLVLFSLALGWTFASSVSLFDKFNDSWRRLLPLLIGAVWGYIVVSLCRWLFPPGQGGVLMENLALWFTLFTAFSAIVSIFAARCRFVTPAPNQVEARARLLVMAPFSIFAFFVIFMFVK